jgi:hypothetical protein
MNASEAAKHLDPAWGAVLDGASAQGAAVWRDTGGRLFTMECRDSSVVQREPYGGEVLPIDADADGVADFPKAAGVGRWELSNGTFLKGKKTVAVKAEAALHGADEP